MHANQVVLLLLATTILSLAESVAVSPTYLCGFTGPAGSRQKCPAGYYCPAGPTPSTPIVPVQCPAGSYCPKGTCQPLLCNCGYKCPAGSAKEIKCQPPFYCPGMGNYNMTLCPIGYSCGEAAMCAPTACCPGTYVTCAGKKSCDQCPAGRYCPTATQSVLCPEGSYCPIGASAPMQCPENQYCPLGSAKPKSCPPRKTSPAGCKSASECK